MSQEDSTRKKLLLITPMLHQGGFEKVCVTTARLMWPYYDVTVLIFTRKDIHYDVKGIKVIDIDVPAADNKALKVVNVLRRVLRVRRIKRHHGFDFSYSFGASANLVNVLSASGERVITSLRGSIDFENETEMKRWCKKSDLLLCVSRAMMERVRKRYGYKNNTFLYNPIDLQQIAQDAKEAVADFPFGGGTRTIVTVSRSDAQKGFWHLVKAFSVASKETEELRLLFVGDGDFSDLRALAQDLNVADKVIFMGVKKNPFPYVAKSDLYVLTSNHEGFPNAMVEAMALGKPVIATDCFSGPREILLSKEDVATLEGNPVWKKMYATYGVLLPDMDHEEDYSANITGEEQALAYEILAMCKDKERYATYCAKSLERAQHFTKERYASGLKKIFDKLDGTDED